MIEAVGIMIQNNYGCKFNKRPCYKKKNGKVMLLQEDSRKIVTAITTDDGCLWFIREGRREAKDVE